MNTKVMWGVVALVVVAGIAYFVMRGPAATAPTDDTTGTNTTTTTTTKKKSVKTAAQLAAEAESCQGVTGQKITIDSPNGGESYSTNESLVITWHTCNQKPGQTVTLAIGTLVGSTTTVGQTIKLLPAETPADGEESVVFGPGSLEGGKWPFAMPGKSFVVTATLNPLPTELEGAAYVHDQSDKPFEIK